MSNQKVICPRCLGQQYFNNGGSLGGTNVRYACNTCKGVGVVGIERIANMDDYQKHMRSKDIPSVVIGGQVSITKGKLRGTVGKLKQVKRTIGNRLLADIEIPDDIPISPVVTIDLSCVKQITN